MASVDWSSMHDQLYSGEELNTTVLNITHYLDFYEGIFYFVIHIILLWTLIKQIKQINLSFKMANLCFIEIMFRFHPSFRIAYYDILVIVFNTEISEHKQYEKILNIAF